MDEAIRERTAFATEVGQTLLANGAAGADHAHTARAVLGSDDAPIMIGYDNVMVLEGVGPAHGVNIAGVPARGFNFGIFTAVALLADRFARGLDSLEQARVGLADVRGATS